MEITRVHVTHQYSHADEKQDNNNIIGFRLGPEKQTSFCCDTIIFWHMSLAMYTINNLVLAL